MKKYLFSLLTLFVSATMCLSLTSCGDDDDEGGSSLRVSEENIVGKWTLSIIEFKHKSGYEASKNTSETDADEMTITLNEDRSGTWYISSEDYVENFKWYISGRKVIMQYGDSFAFTRTLFDVVYLQNDILKTPMDVTVTSTLDYSEYEYVYLVFKRVK